MTRPNAAAPKRETKHTPGPWSVSGRDGDEIWAARTFGATAIATVDPGEDSRANARLIAAAPDLLVALKEIAKGEGPFSRRPLEHAANTIEHMKEIARAAIAKTEGRT